MTMSNSTNNFAHAIGRRIASARRAALLTQEQLAQRLGWPRDTLIHYEHGRRALAVDRLAAIATALGVHPAALLVDDPAFAALIDQLAGKPELRAQVEFFLNTLDETDGPEDQHDADRF
jgi:transcriptional regulator with XRE-family HTH domain